MDLNLDCKAREEMSFPCEPYLIQYQMRKVICGIGNVKI